MLEIIKEQYQSGKTLTQSRFYHVVDRSHFPKYYWDLHPYNQDYYHELNPFFLFNLYRADFLDLSLTLTVKDGLATFVNYLLMNHAVLNKKNTCFLIPPEFASVVPDNLKHKFLAWTLSQPKKISISEAKKAVIFGVLNESYLGSLDIIKTKVSKLKQLPEDVMIEVFLPMRRNPFVGDKESNLHLEIMDVIHQALPGRKFKFLKGNEFTERSDYKDLYLLDLTLDRMMIGDSYVHYSVASKGGTVSALSSKVPENSIFNIPLSFYHHLHVSSLPKMDSIFAELLYLKKQIGKEPLFDAYFFNNLKRMVKTDF